MRDRLSAAVRFVAVLSSPLFFAAATPPAAAAKAPPMEKYVSTNANFVLYRPAGWKVAESSTGSSWVVSAASPDGALETSVMQGENRFGAAENVLAAMIRLLAQASRDFSIKEAAKDRAGTRAVAGYTMTLPGKGAREGRLYVSADRNAFLAVRCEAPAGRLAAARPLLLSVVANLRLMKQGFAPAGAARAPAAQPLQPHRLADGSATVGLPAGWTLDSFGAGKFLARNPADGASFVVGAVDVITPRLGVRAPNIPVSPYLQPSDAWPFVTRGLVANIRYIETIPRPDLDAQMARVFTSGPVRTQELVYTFDGREGPGKGYTFGISFGSRLDTNWTFWHMTLTAPAARFEEYVPTFAAMAQSYAIDDQFRRNYIASGMARLRRMQEETSRIVARNASEIHDMMQAAYDERQRSQDYIDYQRTNYIRGEADWISGVEGGAVYHTDAWGTRNTYTGETWSGAPFDYYNFDGANPKHDESLTPIDNRALYEKVFR